MLIRDKIIQTEFFLLDHEQEKDEMAGGFFRDNSKDDEMKRQPIVLKDLPKVPSNVAQPSVSLSLDATTSSAGESSDEQESEDLSGNACQTESANDLIKQSNKFGTPHIPTKDIQNDTKAVTELITEEENKNSDNAIEENASKTLQLNNGKLDNGKVHSIGNCTTLNGGMGKNIPSDNKHSVEENTVGMLSLQFPDPSVSSNQKSPEISEIDQRDLTPENIIETEMDDLEDQINEKKRLIEKLLSNRQTSKFIKPPSDAKESVGNLVEEKPLSDNGQDNTTVSDASSLGNGNTNNISRSDLPNSMETEANSSVHDVCNARTSQKTEINTPLPNEFEGITYVSTMIFKLQNHQNLYD